VRIIKNYDDLKEHGLTAEEVTEILNEHYRTEITADKDVVEIKPGIRLVRFVCVEDGRDVWGIQAD
jgi:hypothetical protein